MLILKGNFPNIKLCFAWLAMLLACAIAPQAQAAPRAPDAVAVEFYGWYLDTLTAEFGPGEISPFVVAFKTTSSTFSDQNIGALYDFTEWLKAQPGIVRVQGIDAGFPTPSYAPGQQAVLQVATDAKSLTFQVFAYGGGAFPSVRDVRGFLASTFERAA